MIVRRMCKIRTAVVIVGICCLGGFTASQAHAKKPRITVPPTHEIEVLDPGVDPLGRPAVVLGEPTPTGNRLVDIPPVVIVHRYYYTGDREFQGPMFPGGPSILVVNHPETGHRLYLEAQMLPGSPLVRYSKQRIEYDYGQERITLKFSKWGCEPKVAYETGRPLPIAIAKTATKVTAKTGAATADLIARTGAPNLIVTVGEKTVHAAQSGAERIHDVGSFAAGKVAQVIEMFPLTRLLSIPPEELARRERDRELEEAAKDLRDADLYLPTNR